MGNFSALAFLCVVWGVNWVAIKISLEGFPPLMGAAARFFLAVIFLFPYIKWKKISLKVNRYEFKMLFISGFLVYVLDYGLLYWGEQYLSAGVTSIFFSTFAMFTALASNFVFRNEPFQWSKYVGLTVGLMGIMVVFYDQVAVTKFNTLVIMASCAVLVGAIGAALSTVVVKKYLEKMNTVKLTFHQMVMGTIMLGILSAIFEWGRPVELNLRIGLVMLYMGAIASAAAFVYYYQLLQRMSAVSLSFIIYVIPLVALVTDYFVYDEILRFRSFIGMVIIFTGIWLSMLDKKRINIIKKKLKKT